MNKRQALQGLLADEEAQEQRMTHAHVPSQPQQRSPQFPTGQDGEPTQQHAHAPSAQGELDWYEE